MEFIKREPSTRAEVDLNEQWLVVESKTNLRSLCLHMKRNDDAYVVGHFRFSDNVHFDINIPRIKGWYL